MMHDLPPLKPHQVRGIAAIQEARRNKGKPILAVAPPGAGKSRAMLELAIDEVKNRHGRVLIKAHRKMLLDQLVEAFQKVDIDIGVMSPDYIPNPSAPIQIVSSQTLFSRAIRRSSVELPDASLIINDEAHQQASKVERALMFGAISEGMATPGYLQRGADICGFTATPIMAGRIYDQMVDFATYSELRRTGMHQLVKTYGPDEIDTTGLKTNASGDYSERALEGRVQTIFASVFDSYLELNPGRLPAILFAPSVPSSRWFAEQFMARGITAAHMDGEECLIPEGGKLVVAPSNREVRQHILERSKGGDINIITNRFVLREAVDMPWLYHAIAATVFGSTTTALQSVGRLQRFCSDYECKIFQDHGGFYWRHGSPNEDREWRLGLNAKAAKEERVSRVLAGELHEGIRCPKCGMWRQSGPICMGCNNKHTRSVRAVRMLNGSLKLMTGRVYTKTQSPTEAQKLWTQTLFSAGRSNKPVSSAVAIFTNKCSAKGIRVDWSQLRNEPPPPGSAQYDLLVKDVFPWTARKKS